MKATRWMLKAASLILALSDLSSAATVHGQLVYSSNNAPAAYVAVRLSIPGKSASEFGYSGADGKYYLRNIPAGDYQLEVWRGNRIVATVAVRVHEPDTALVLTRVP